MNAAQIKRELRTAVRELSGRGLILASKWHNGNFSIYSCCRAAELCAGISEPAAKAPPIDDDDPEEDVFQLVKLCMSAREYRRAAFLAANARTSRLVFMRRYALYLVRC